LKRIKSTKGKKLRENTDHRHKEVNGEKNKGYNMGEIQKTAKPRVQRLNRNGGKKKGRTKGKKTNKSRKISRSLGVTVKHNHNREKQIKKRRGRKGRYVIRSTSRTRRKGVSRSSIKKNSKGGEIEQPERAGEGVQEEGGSQGLTDCSQKILCKAVVNVTMCLGKKSRRVRRGFTKDTNR